MTAQHKDPAWLNGFDLIIAHDTITKRSADRHEPVMAHNNVILVPVLLFDGFTPDDEITVSIGSQAPTLVSKIAIGAFRRGLSNEDAHQLYYPEFCELMGYNTAVEQSRANLIRRVSPVLPNIEQLYAKWFARGVFFYTPNHPKLFVIEDVLRHVLRNYSELVLPQGGSISAWTRCRCSRSRLR